MRTSRIASTITIVPSTLGETEFIGPTNGPRVIGVDMIRGTITVSARSANDGPTIPGSFVWFIPHVPLSTVTPLLEELAPHVERALRGAKPRPNNTPGWTLKLSDDGEAQLEAADAIVDAFYYRWTGRHRTGGQYARCLKCGDRIIKAVNEDQGRWRVSSKPPGCGHAGEHEPPPSGPYCPRQLVPGHEMFLQETESGWSGTCECRTWDRAAAEWRPVVESHYLHAEAPAPGAPFDTPNS